MRVYVQSWLTNDEKQSIRDKITGQELLFAGEMPPEERPIAAADAQVIFGNIPPAWIPDCHQLNWLQLDSTGIDNYLRPDIEFTGIKVTHLKGFYARPVAETAVGGILALYRKLDELIRLQQLEKWNYKGIRPSLRLLHESKVLILGGGAIGLQIKKLLAAFDCQVTIYSRSSPPANLTQPEQLPQAFEYHNIIINCLPQTAETTGLISAGLLDQMNEMSVFVNVGRGSAVDEPHLIRKLQKHELAGAVIDVSEKEPIPAGHPLWHCPNTILSQHTSGGYQQEGMHKADIFIRNFKLFQQGEPLEGMVDFRKGY